MDYLTGSSDHQMDTKYRIRIPGKFRPLLGNDISFMAGQNCICVYSRTALNEMIERKIKPITSDDTERYAAARRLLSSIESVKEDDQGRIVVPPHLRAIAKLTKEVRSVGMIDHVEIWAKEVYDSDPAIGDSKQDFAVIGI